MDEERSKKIAGATSGLTFGFIAGPLVSQEDKDLEMKTFLKLINEFSTTLKRVTDLPSAKRRFLFHFTVPADENALLSNISLQVHPKNEISQGNK